ncbi:MAG: sulfatase-like hydrolase/transferase [Planctomycetes bacterium]|nr:sulfatase-like hydrolase/transferase [Planctomycetota bacterium]
MKGLSYVLLAALMSAAMGLRTFAEPPQRMNVVFLLSDDQRADVLSCAGFPVIQTPNIDKLAAGGVRFANGFVTTSICAASRATCFTGLVERTHRFTFGTPPIAMRFIDDSYPVLLRAAGYRTGFFGKFGVHVEGGKKTTERMFDEYADLFRNPYIKKLPDGTMRHIDDIEVDRAIDFLRATPKGTPFCLSVSFNGGHAEDGDKEHQYTAAPPEQELYSDVKMPRPNLDDPTIFEAMPEFLKKSMNRERYFWRWDTPEKYDLNMRNYLRLLTTVDRNVGRVMEELAKEGLTDKTIVIYMGDNGYYMGERGFAGKWTHFDESQRVPLIVFDPRLPAGSRGRVANNISLNLDIAPTILDGADVTIPARYQGRSLLPLMRDGHAADSRAGFFCEHLMNHKDIPKWEGYRNGRYVYARYFEQNPPYEFLHDLEKDPSELQNFASDPAYADVLAKMRRTTDEWRDKYDQEGKGPQAEVTPESRRGE